MLKATVTFVELSGEDHQGCCAPGKPGKLREKSGNFDEVGKKNGKTKNVTRKPTFLGLFRWLASF